MGLIKVKDAAARLGVSRQTLENWGKCGIIKVHKTGASDKSHWVDDKIVEKLSDTMRDVEHAQVMLDSERKALKEEYIRERDTLRDLRRQMYWVDRFSTTFTAKSFYMCIPSMLYAIGQIDERECRVMSMVIDGYDFAAIAKKFCLSRASIMIIFGKACRKARSIEHLKEQLDELEALRAEVADMKKSMKVLNDELEVQRKAERELMVMDAEERMRHIESIDSVLKVLSTPLRDCDLSVRVLNGARSVDIETVGDLCKWTKTELLSGIRNFGKKSLTEVQDFLESLNLSFGMDVDQIYRERAAAYTEPQE